MFYQKVIGPALVMVLGLSAGASAVAQSSPDAAEAQLRAVLAASSEADWAREKLSVLLLQTGRRDGALYHARYLSRRAGSPLLRSQAKELVERLDGPAWGWRPILKFAPSTNLNKAATGDTIFVGDQAFSIDADSRAKDGVGLTFGAAGWWNWRPSEAWRGTITGEASATVYPDSDLETQQNLRATLTFDRRIGKHALALGLSAEASAEKGDLERLRFGPFLSARFNITPKRQLTARLDWRDVDFPDETFRSGYTAGVTLGWTEALSPTMQLRFSLPLAKERTGRAHLDNDSVGLSVNLDKVWASGSLRTSFGVAYSQDSYIGTFPGSTMARNDRFTTLSLELSNSNLTVRGFTPTIRYEYTTSSSNIPLYDYDSHDVQVTFQKAF